MREFESVQVSVDVICVQFASLLLRATRLVSAAICRDRRTDRMKATAFTTTHIGRPSVLTPPSVSVYRRRRHHHCVQCVKQDQRKGEGERGQARTTMDLRSAEAACLSALLHPTKKNDHLLDACSSIGGDMLNFNMNPPKRIVLCKSF